MPPCQGCNTELPYKGRGRPPKWCKRCRNSEIAEKKRAYYEQHKDEIAEKQRAYREQHKDEIAEKQRAYYERNKDENGERPKSGPSTPQSWLVAVEIRDEAAA